MSVYRSNAKACITLVPCITASGEKLKLSWINDAKTYRAVREMTIPGAVHTYISTSGWMTRDIMCQWLIEVVIPYLHDRPGALILDQYKPHWMSEV